MTGFRRNRSSYSEKASLTELLGGIRRALDTDVVWMFVHEACEADAFEFVEGSSPAGWDTPLPGEQFWLSRRGSPAPHREHDLVVASRSRHYRIVLGEALLIPWGRNGGGGVVVSGMRSASDVLNDSVEAERLPALELEARWAADQAAMMARTRREFSQAVRDISSAVVERRDTPLLLQSMLSAARRLFRTDVAYLSLADSGDHDALYTFAATLGVVTPQFRRIRLEHDQGLGGLARRSRAPVTTVEYDEDGRFREPPVDETRAEGIHSAMCAPLLIDGRVAGCLYAGNRQLSAFGADQLDAFAEFADHVARGVGTHQLDRHRAANLRRQERELLASRVHESTVRNLVEIGWTAEAAAHREALGEHTEDHWRRVSDLAVTALAALRSELDDMSSSRSRFPVPAGQVMARLDAIAPVPGKVRHIEAQSSALELLLDPEVADALEYIGSEALVNSNLHSVCPEQVLELAVDAEGISLTVADVSTAGSGGTGREAAAAAGTDAGHLGQRAIRRRAHDVGGSLVAGPATTGGWRVHAWLPRRTSSER